MKYTKQQAWSSSINIIRGLKHAKVHQEHTEICDRVVDWHQLHACGNIGDSRQEYQNAPNVLRSTNLSRKLLPWRIKRQKAESPKTEIKIVRKNNFD